MAESNQNISIRINGESKEVDPATTGVQLFEDDKNIVAVKINGIDRDLYTPLKDGDNVEPIALDSADGLAIMRHSATHVMAQAVQDLFPDAKLGIGPVIKDGFYYDFDVKQPFTPDDLKRIEKQMQKIIKEGQTFQRRVVSQDEAREEEKDQPYKLQLIDRTENEIKNGDESEKQYNGELSMYDNVRKDGSVAWKDLCHGPHLPNTRLIGAFKLQRSAAAYWLGDEHNPSMQRIYGTTFATKEALKKHLDLLEEAAKRDHRKIGRDLDLFSFQSSLDRVLLSSIQRVEQSSTLWKITRARCIVVRATPSFKPRI